MFGLNNLRKAARPAPKASCWCGSIIGLGHSGSGGGGGHSCGPLACISTPSLSPISTSEDDSLSNPDTFSTLVVLGSSRWPYILAKNFRGDDGRGVWIVCTVLESVWPPSIPSSSSSLIVMKHVLPVYESLINWPVRCILTSLRKFAPPPTRSLSSRTGINGKG